eukprot:TRINITY_DN4201_c0_g1_i3.p1 TRINITY_DN4201_c0_g1~~TRINITY_DN4201_c0_g1_i3.p1  ORF type:complete len:223 (+),score=32.31 TRINITY_DN4201_c0_g1_i3:20-688(+)
MGTIQESQDANQDYVGAEPCVLAPDSCFPAEASVMLQRGPGVSPLAVLVAGDGVVARHPAGDVVHSRVMGFIHDIAEEMNPRGRHITLEHAGGAFRATAAHIVFKATSGGFVGVPVTACRVGDHVVDARQGGEPREVLAIHDDRSLHGLRSPLTLAGTVVVDGMLASSYSALAAVSLPHAAMHASFFVVRAMFELPLPAQSSKGQLVELLLSLKLSASFSSF